MGHFTLEIKDEALVVYAVISVIKLICHVLFKALVFRLIYKKGSLVKNPINILILVEEVEHLVLISVLEVSTFYLRYNTNVEASHGQAGCLFLHVYVFIVSMMTMYTFTGEGILEFFIAASRAE